MSALFSRRRAAAAPEAAGTLCGDLSFAAAESYKLLRANLMFTLSDSDSASCRVIGVTSATRTEGKSTTSINLAYTLAETGKRVLLIDGDMRLPTIARRLKLHRAPGLSNLIAGLSGIESVIQSSGVMRTLYVIASGDPPPNPSELLGSGRLKSIVDKLREKYDYIIIDLPPVTIVSDALVVAPVTDGLLMVVRQGYTREQELTPAMRQLEYQKAKLLGFVVTHSTAQGKRYQRRNKKKYGKYGYGYGEDYGSPRARRAAPGAESKP